MKVKDFLKKWWWAIIALVLVILFIVFVVIKWSDEPSKSIPVSITQSEQDSLQNVIAELQNDLANTAAERDNYKAELDTCENDIQRPLTLEERLAIAESELIKLKTKPAPTKRSYVKQKRVTVKNDVEETKFEAVTFTAPAVKVSSQMTQASDNTASNIQYKAVFKGDVGATITPKLNPIYYVKGGGSIKSAPYWCGDSNKKMSYDQETGYWFYIDYGRILSDQELTDSNFYLLWNVFIGTVNWGGGSYKAWLPHESIKPLLNSVRGFEYGFITNDDLNQMSRKDSRIWSPNNPGGIYQPIKEAVHERTDPNFWHGWNYRVKVNFTRIIN